MQVIFLDTLYRWYGKRNVLITAAIIASLLIIGFVVTRKGQSAPQDSLELLPTVTLASAASLSNQTGITLIGTVKAVSQAELKSEVGGRVVAVNARLSQRVTAGSVIIQLESASERANVLQAEGVYDAAVAAAAQSNIGVDQAVTSIETAENNLAGVRNSIKDLYRTAYNTSNQIVLEDIDELYRNPLILRATIIIDTRTQGKFLINERVAFRSLFSEWQTKLQTVSQMEPRAVLTEVDENVKRVIAVLDAFIELLPRTEASETFTQAQIDASLNSFTSARSQLAVLLNAVQTNQTALINAEKVLETTKSSLNQAEISGTDGDVSAANAQIKQALGALRSAQANLAKKIITTPISGEVNSLDVQVGDFVAPQTKLGVIANNNALEITTFVGESDRDLLAIGQTVLIDNQYEGKVVNIAPAINTDTKKIEVKIATESELLENGNTVTIESVPTEGIVDSTIYLPITAVKFTDTSGYVFMVEDGKLTSIPVEIGVISGSSVEITTGITRSDLIVVDARGLVNGQAVEALTR